MCAPYIVLSGGLYKHFGIRRNPIKNDNILEFVTFNSCTKPTPYGRRIESPQLLVQLHEPKSVWKLSKRKGFHLPFETIFQFSFSNKVTGEVNKRW